MSQHIPKSLSELVHERSNGMCEYCRLPQSSQEATFHIDHIQPLTANGPTVLENLALACVTCSLRNSRADQRPRCRHRRTHPAVSSASRSLERSFSLGCWMKDRWPHAHRSSHRRSSRHESPGDRCNPPNTGEVGSVPTGTRRLRPCCPHSVRRSGLPAPRACPRGMAASALLARNSSASARDRSSAEAVEPLGQARGACFIL